MEASANSFNSRRCFFCNEVEEVWGPIQGSCSREDPSLSPKQEWLPAVRGKGMEILGTFVRRGGQIYADMTFNNKAMQMMADFAIQFNKNRYTIQCVRLVRNGGSFLPLSSLPLSLSPSPSSPSFGLAPGPLAVNSPLMPNCTASTLLPITPGGLVMKMSPLTQLQVAIKNNVDVFYFSVNMPTHVLFSEDGTMDRKVFLATWKEIPQSNEVQASVDNVSLTPDQVQQKLETNNVFLIARRQVDVGGLNQELM
ncbi:AP-1 complex subunit beta-1 [Geodia barretti]|uniref:AP-1 complex subunit beta-1 n=1 Tax=Geodia barretti TaxID=519541 RepID=A0AA35SY82_GEOBA|nr:AP-1 complex subunit beta-1 [Geodia barretti]